MAKAQGFDVIIQRCRQEPLLPCSLLSTVPIVTTDRKGTAQLLQVTGMLGYLLSCPRHAASHNPNSSPACSLILSLFWELHSGVQGIECKEIH